MKNKFPVDQGTTNPISQTPYLDVDSKPDTDSKEADCYQGKAVILLDPTKNPIKAIGANNPLRISLSDGSNPTQLGTINAYNYGQTLSPNDLALNVKAAMYLYDSVAGNSVAQRTAAVFKNIYATAAGSTAIWTSGAGKKWRILGGQIIVSQGSTTAAGPLVIRLLDVAADTGIGVTLSTGALPAAPGAIVVLNLANLGNGITAAASNTALNIDLSNAFTAGGVSVLLWGCEE